MKPSSVKLVPTVPENGQHKTKLVRTLREQIVDQIRNDVLAGQMAEHQPLREIDLAQRFGVSRGPIRDALLQLTQEGLLVYQPNCGVRVGSGASESIRGLIVTLRRTIEADALDRLWNDLTPETLAEWDELLERLRAACIARDMSEIVKHDVGFHRSLVRKGGGEELEVIWLPITVRMRLVYSRHLDLIQVYEEHKRILDLVHAGDKRAAIAELEGHIR